MEYEGGGVIKLFFHRIVIQNGFRDITVLHIIDSRPITEMVGITDL